MEPLAYTIDEAAEITRLSRSEIKRHIKSGELVVARVGRRVLVRRDRLDEWLIANERGAA